MRKDDRLRRCFAYDERKLNRTNKSLIGDNIEEICMSSGVEIGGRTDKVTSRRFHPSHLLLEFSWQRNSALLSVSDQSDRQCHA
jgi:hypothetical protein